MLIEVLLLLNIVVNLLIVWSDSLEEIICWFGIVNIIFFFNFGVFIGILLFLFLIWLKIILIDLICFVLSVCIGSFKLCMFIIFVVCYFFLIVEVEIVFLVVIWFSLLDDGCDKESL